MQPPALAATSSPAFDKSPPLQPTRATSPTRAQGAWLGTRPSTSLGEVDHPQARRAEDGRVGATPFVWDGEVLAAELDDQRGPRAFVHEPGGFEPVLQQQGGETFLCVNDHLGMPKDLVSGDGLVVWTAAHSAYGRVIAVDADLAAKARYGESASVTAGARGTATGIESPFRLLGQIADEDAELGWTRFRCFDQETGRWLSPDPMGLAAGTNALGFDGPPTMVVDELGLNGTQGGSPHVHSTTPTDLHAFGNATSPRPPRIDNPNGKSDLTTTDGKVQPSTSQGASTFGDPSKAPVSGNYHKLPAGTQLPEGLGVVSDGKDVGGSHAPTHHTIVPTREMTPEEFNEKFQSLPWQKAGKK